MARLIDPLTRGSRCQHGAVLTPRANRQQQQQGDGCSTPDCKGIAVRHFGMMVGSPPDITDTSKCRSCQAGKQQQGG